MAATPAPHSGTRELAATPVSEKSVYYDADDASTEHVAHAGPPTGDGRATNPGTGKGARVVSGADVTRKPSVATGALEPREPVGGGILANKDEKSRINDFFSSSPTSSPRVHNEENVGATGGSVRDSGYAPGPDTREQRPIVSFTAPQDVKHEKEKDRTVQEDQPSPAYAEQNETFGAADKKASSRRSTEKFSGGTAQPLPDSQTRTSGEKEHHVSGAFANGAAITSPDAVPDEDISQHQRTATAESLISPEAKKKIAKAEQKDAKRLLKVIKAEGKAQNANLSAFLKEFSKLQQVQRQASKDESKVLAQLSKAAAREHKLQTRYLAAKAQYEQGEADLRARTEALEAARTHAQRTTADLAVKTREAEELRRAKMVDDREREAKKSELKQIGK